ncbi:hypothetical protein MK280_14920 [Myxococcota bacterium]|nr:hypothetical protein [Myxococcota bacterium]
MTQVESVIFGRFEVQRIDRWRPFMRDFYGLELKPSPLPGERSPPLDRLCQLWNFEPTTTQSFFSGIARS